MTRQSTMASVSQDSVNLSTCPNNGSNSALNTVIS